MTKEQAQDACISTRVQHSETGIKGTVSTAGKGYVKITWDDPPRDMFNQDELQSLDLIGDLVSRRKDTT